MAVSTSMHWMNLWKNRSTIALVIVISLSDMGILLPLGRFGVGGIADASRRLPGGKGWFTESRTVIGYINILHPGRFECDIFQSRRSGI
jgi:hypothetical protein